MSVSQNSIRVAQTRPPRKVEFTGTTTTRRVWVRGEMQDRVSARVLCTASYGLGMWKRFVWWESHFPSKARAERSIAQVLQAAKAIHGSAR